MKNKIKFLCDLLRVKQWVKNAFIFFPLIFSGTLFQPGYLINCIVTFSGFCLTASGMYVLNDYIDRHKDRLHPRKARRPLARVEIQRSTLILIVAGLVGAGLWTCWRVNPLVLAMALTYIILQFVYNFFIKRVVIIDVIFIALGFHVRILAGALAIGGTPSVWLQLCVFILALFLGFTKRRHEMHVLKDKAHEHRLVLAHYTSYLLDQLIIICSTLAIVFYGLYTISPEIVSRLGNYRMSYSVIFVVYGIFRYLYLVHVKKMGNDPGEALFFDWPLFFCIILWVGYVGILIYMPHVRF